MRLRGLLIILCLAISMIPVAIIGAFQGFEIATAFLGLIIVVTFFFSLIISYFITLPLEKLTKNIDEISKGNLDVNIENSEIYEIDKLTESLNRVMASLKLAIRKVGIKKGEIFEETIKAKEEAEERYKDLLKSMDGWVWEINEKGVCHYCSKQIVDALGYTPEEIIGRRFVEFIAPEEIKKVKNTLRELAINNKGNPKKFKTKLVHKTGNNVPIFISFILISDDSGNFRGFRGIGRDYSESIIAREKFEHMNKKLAEMKERMRSIVSEKELKNKPLEIPTMHQLTKEEFNYKPIEKPTIQQITEEEFDAIFIFDENANIIDCNKSMYDKLGYEKEEMLSMNLIDLDFLETKDNIEKRIKEIKRQGNIKFKTIHRKKNGTSIFVNENVQYIKDKNVFKCIVKEDPLNKTQNIIKTN